MTFSAEIHFSWVAQVRLLAFKSQREIILCMLVHRGMSILFISETIFPLCLHYSFVPISLGESAPGSERVKGLVFNFLFRNHCRFMCKCKKSYREVLRDPVCHFPRPPMGTSCRTIGYYHSRMLIHKILTIFRFSYFSSIVFMFSSMK
jgi:hypothetical protein